MQTQLAGVKECLCRLIRVCLRTHTPIGDAHQALYRGAAAVRHSPWRPHRDDQPVAACKVCAATLLCHPPLAAALAAAPGCCPVCKQATVLKANSQFARPHAPRSLHRLLSELYCPMLGLSEPTGGPAGTAGAARAAQPGAPLPPALSDLLLQVVSGLGAAARAAGGGGGGGGSGGSEAGVLGVLTPLDELDHWAQLAAGPAGAQCITCVRFIRRALLEDAGCELLDSCAS